MLSFLLLRCLPSPIHCKCNGTFFVEWDEIWELSSLPVWEAKQPIRVPGFALLLFSRHCNQFYNCSRTVKAGASVADYTEPNTFQNLINSKVIWHRSSLHDDWKKGSVECDIVEGLSKKCSFVQSHHNGDCTLHSDGQRWLISSFIRDTKKYFYPKHIENVCVDHVFVHSCRIVLRSKNTLGARLWIQRLKAMGCGCFHALKWLEAFSNVNAMSLCCQKLLIFSVNVITGRQKFEHRTQKGTCHLCFKEGRLKQGKDLY